jgi:hypothetical protein
MINRQQIEALTNMCSTIKWAKIITKTSTKKNGRKRQKFLVTKTAAVLEDMLYDCRKKYRSNKGFRSCRSWGQAGDGRWTVLETDFNVATRKFISNHPHLATVLLTNPDEALTDMIFQYILFGKICIEIDSSI